jgi:shikimate kinase / 3-dehydroquinate synthase
MSSPTEPPARIIVTGFSGTGKSAVGPLIAKQLGWELVDTDDVIETEAGKRILEIFATGGERAFRDMETRALQDVCSRENVVIATGGGAILRPENRRLLAKSGFIVCLEARPETIFARLHERADAAPLDRPLLASDDPLGRIRELKNARAHLYALCDWTVHTDLLSAEEVAAEVVRAYNDHAAEALATSERVEAIGTTHAVVPAGTLHMVREEGATIVQTSSREYPVYTGWGILNTLGRRLREFGLMRFAYVICDETVWHHLGDEIEASLRSAEIDFDSYAVPPGEASKSLEMAKDIYDWLIDHKAERGHAVVAVGGGVATDLGGYVAATFARGLPLVHVPTSMLGMVDAAIGGKVAVNHPEAKNMIGVFCQPRFVLADAATLRTLPSREIKSGMAEAIKHGLIEDPAYLDFLEHNADKILRLDRDATVHAVRRSVEIKADVVSEDEFETTGRRSTLNYGHTLAHAIESTTGYARFRHGEADGIGMMAAASIAVRMSVLSPEVLERQRRILECYGLPTHADGLDRARLLAAIALDKKVQGKKVRWILLEDVGRTVIRDNVPPEVVEAALDDVLH